MYYTGMYMLFQCWLDKLPEELFDPQEMSAREFCPGALDQLHSSCGQRANVCGRKEKEIITPSLS